MIWRITIRGDFTRYDNGYTCFISPLTKEDILKYAPKAQFVKEEEYEWPALMEANIKHYAN